MWNEASAKHTIQKQYNTGDALKELNLGIWENVILKLSPLQQAVSSYVLLP